MALARSGLHVLTVYPGPTRTEHARRYSPDNRREARRMAPERVAHEIYQATCRKQRTLIPGAGNRLSASVGQLMPGLTESIMRRALLDRIDRRSGGD
ncbi:MAG: hypothetical protein HC802_02645 [Caldilineaceae bacterium]|nr:hypothetical protein [Caldilineaceae bacterium]